VFSFNFPKVCPYVNILWKNSKRKWKLKKWNFVYEACIRIVWFNKSKCCATNIVLWSFRNKLSTHVFSFVMQYYFQNFSATFIFLSKWSNEKLSMDIIHEKCKIKILNVFVTSKGGSLRGWVLAIFLHLQMLQTIFMVYSWSS
jgi:hypothetical protein